MNACVAKLSTPTYSTVVSLFTSRVVCGFGNSKMSASLWASKSKKRRSQIKTLLITNRRTSPPNHKLPCSVYSYCRCVQSKIQKIRIFQISQLDGFLKVRFSHKFQLEKSRNCNIQPVIQVFPILKVKCGFRILTKADYNNFLYTLRL